MKAMKLCKCLHAPGILKGWNLAPVRVKSPGDGIVRDSILIAHGANSIEQAETSVEIFLSCAIASLYNNPVLGQASNSGLLA